LYVGGIGLATAIYCGIISKAAISAMFYNLVAKVSAINLVVGGLLAVIGKFALEVVINMAIASFSNEDVILNTTKIWGWDTGIPYSVGLV